MQLGVLKCHECTTHHDTQWSHTKTKYTSSTSTSTSTSTPSTSTAPSSLPIDPSTGLPPPSMEDFQQFLKHLSNPDGNGKELLKALGADDQTMPDFMKLLQEMSSQPMDPTFLNALSALDAATNNTTPPATTQTNTQNKTETNSTTSTSTSTSTSSPSPSSTTTATTTTTTSNSSSTAPTDSVTDAIRMIAEGAKKLPQTNTSSAPGVDSQFDEILNKVLGDMGNLGLDKAMNGAQGFGPASGDSASDDKKDSGEIDKFVETIMGQMLSKDYLYQPIKELADKYPAYLASNREKLAEAELTNYEKQHACIQKIVVTLEAEGNNQTQIMSLMSEMQSYGSPPAELVEGFLPPGFNPSQPMPGFGPGGPFASLAGLNNNVGQQQANTSGGEMPAMNAQEEEMMKRILDAMMADASHPSAAGQNFPPGAPPPLPNDCKMQ